MTANLTVRESKFSDINQLVSTIREKDRQECLRLGFTPRVALIYGYKNAFLRHTALVNGKVGAMWGVVGQVTSTTGFPYFVTSIYSEEVSPIRFARLYKQEVRKMNDLFPKLVNYVDSSYEESVRLLKLTGFKVEEPGPKGFCRFTMSKEP